MRTLRGFIRTVTERDYRAHIVPCRACTRCGVAWKPTTTQCPHCGAACQFLQLDSDNDWVIVDPNTGEYTIDELRAWSKINHDNFEDYYYQRDLERFREEIELAFGPESRRIFRHK
jgi:hypothetical protein